MSKKKYYLYKFSNDTYYNNYSKFPKLYDNCWQKYEYETTDIVSAKSYKTKSGADRSLIKFKDVSTDRIKALNAQLNHPNTQPYYKNAIKNNITREKELLVVLNDCTVVEVEIDEDAKKRPTIRFKKDGEGYSGFNGYEKGASGNSYCRICGMVLAGLPYFVVGSGWKNSLTVCPMCIIEQAQKAELLLGTMDKELRTEMEQERFLKRLG